ncbi:hypothetical protein [Microbacterium sp. LWH11-1.2]|uniref:hypothetical protein n=1 Tax=Microbacterium sp. LWH11-1.2 TaxID=3135258 RepID=UPI00313984F5
MRRAATTILTAALLLPALTGCAMNACPAIGYVSVLTVDAGAYGDDVWVQLCVPGGCSVGPDGQETPSTDPTVPFVGEEPGEFLFLAVPDAVTAHVFAADGTLLAEQEHAITWTHSTEQCGGPSTTPPLVLEP